MFTLRFVRAAEKAAHCVCTAWKLSLNKTFTQFSPLLMTSWDLRPSVL